MNIPALPNERSSRSVTLPLIRCLFPALCALLLVFAACKNPIIAEWYREDDKENQSSTAAPASQSAVLRTVNDLALTYNVPAPYGGETPVRSFAGPQYEGRVDWSISGGGAHNGPFVTGTAYTALVNIVAAAGWTFDGVAENSFAHLGGAGAAVRNAAGAGTALLVIIEFAPAENALPVDDLNLTFYVPAPETGGIPALSLAGPQYTGVVSWDSSGGAHNGIFQPSAVYTATVTMQPASGRTFNGVGQNAFRHWAAAAGVANAANSGVVTIVFPATGPGQAISSPIDLTAYIRQPVIVGQPVRNFRTAACYGTVEWEPGVTAPDGFFLKDTVYTAKVTLFPVTGYVFPGGLTVIHTRAAAVNITEANPVRAEVSIVFPDTRHILPLAAGGDVSITWTGVPGYYYETHTFKAADTVPAGGQAVDYLVFTGGDRPADVEVLVVAGGGGGGASAGATWHAGGGGAGGYIFVPAYPISANSIEVRVGAGGARAASVGSGALQAARGGTGGNSQFGGITANGGGGGASHGGGTYNTGGGGGSGGGATYVANTGAANPGAVVPAVTAVMLGHAGGGNTVEYSGCGGGGAGGPGGSPGGVKQRGALGGAGTISAISGAGQWYAGGGSGGAAVQSFPSGTPPEAYGAVQGANGDADTGDGGSGGGGVSGKNLGGSGGSGIVIIRFLNPGYTG